MFHCCATQMYHSVCDDQSLNEIRAAEATLRLQKLDFYLLYQDTMIIDLRPVFSNKNLKERLRRDLYVPKIAS